MQGDVIPLRREIAKNKNRRMVLVVGKVANIVARRQAERVISCPYVFHREEQRIKHYAWAWRMARKKAGPPGRLLHDARRAAVRDMNRAHVPRQTAKQITSNKTDAIYNRYRIVYEQDICERMLKAHASLVSQNLGQDPNT